MSSCSLLFLFSEELLLIMGTLFFDAHIQPTSIAWQKLGTNMCFRQSCSASKALIPFRPCLEESNSGSLYSLCTERQKAQRLYHRVLSKCKRLDKERDGPHKICCITSFLRQYTSHTVAWEYPRMDPHFLSSYNISLPLTRSAP